MVTAKRIQRIAKVPAMTMVTVVWDRFAKVGNAKKTVGNTEHHVLTALIVVATWFAKVGNAGTFSKPVYIAKTEYRHFFATEFIVSAHLVEELRPRKQ